ncbi:translation initiation factor IF-2 [Candidatus Woesearchaeota archaeon]|nr:translation initiation factor IF-2 [Candidatus Woesearchaeota archaeon]
MKMAQTRALICLLTGHVDHGKSQIIETISKRKIIAKEAGRITQKISAVKTDIKDISSLMGGLLSNFKSKIKIPGFLFIDSPGHAAFTNLRKRGGSLADIAILVVDANEGILEQTKEAVEILKQYKTPFIIALNKIDLISGWRSNKEKGILDNINSQGENVRNKLDIKLYEVVGKVHELGFNAERFDRVSDYTKQVAIVPISAKTGEGLQELLFVLIGLAQKYLEKELQVELSRGGKGVILEVREDKGLGTVLDVVLYDGKIRVNDDIIIGGLEEPIVSKVRNMFEMRKPVDKVEAAANVTLIAPNLENVYSGMPLMVAEKRADIEKIKKEIQEQVEEVLIESSNEGIIAKADSLGSLEALIGLLKESNIPIKRAGIGEINKKDVAEAESQKDELNRVIVGFNVKNVKEEVSVITSDVIYEIIEKLEKWREGRKREEETKKLKKLLRPCKIYVIPNFVFRQSNPAVVGVEVLGGTLKSNMHLMNGNGKRVADVKSIQDEGKNLDEAGKGKQVAISLPGVIVGRQIVEGQVLLSDINEPEFKKLKEMKSFLNSDEIGLLKEIAELKRKDNPLWGV